MMHSKRIIGINIGLVVLYMGSLFLVAVPDIRFLFAMVVMLVIHTIGAIITSFFLFIKKKSMLGKTFLLAGILVLLIGGGLFLLKSHLL